ncbi:MAG: hypothetical protein K2N56_07805 [Oscillospiraceae bacterium]|nr:hypothetical protein [Oscillospiraceae bacterium]
MILRITLKDIAAFMRSERKVFFWLLACMVCGSFVLNYSYSFARWRGEMYEYAVEADVPRYKIRAKGASADADALIKALGADGFPETESYQFFGETDEGLKIAGSSFISKSTGAFTGYWTEGYKYKFERSETNACAVNNGLLEYGERFKMTGEPFTLDGEEFTIRGVYEAIRGDCDIVIFPEKFLEKYDKVSEVWITFAKRLDDAQLGRFEQLVRERLPGGNITKPPESGVEGSNMVKANELQYSAIVIMLVVCLVSLIKYWQSVNLPAYTVYWINGASNGVIIGVALCESLILCGSTYLVGLGLNALSRLFMTKTASLTANDILIGFGIFFGVFAVFTLINTVRVCKRFKVANIRRD